MIVGGDGTVSSVLPHFLNSKVNIGIVPFGTANDLARELKIAAVPEKRDAAAVISRFSEYIPKPVSVWRISCLDSGREAFFCNYASFGFDAQTVFNFSRWRAKIGKPGVFGNRLLYIFAGAASLGTRVPPAVVSSETGAAVCTPAARSLFLSNIRCLGGMGRANAESDACDDKIEINIVPRVSDYLRLLLGHEGGRARVIGSSQRWEIRGLPHAVMVQIDGEPRPDLMGSEYRVETAGFVNLLCAKST